MTRDEHKQAIQKLFGMIAQDHSADASEILTNLSEDYEQTLTASETASANVAQLTEKNEKLREVNANLFLKVGVGEAPTKNQEETKQTNTEDKPLPFSDLFNEKGELI